MPSPERKFGVISQRGSAEFQGTELQIEDDLLFFLAHIRDWSIGTVPASAPKKKESEE